MKPRYYTGIGSRKTPEPICRLMFSIAHHLGPLGFTLRSGHAEGADLAFEAGTFMPWWPKEIYLPWTPFNGTKVPAEWLPTVEASALAAQYHPNWAACSIPARALLARNSHQVLGRDLATPSEFVVCWTPGAKGGGGTGQAIRIARAYGIPVFDLADETTRVEWQLLLSGDIDLPQLVR